MANQADVPEEIQEEYYQAPRKERAGVAWLLAFGTLIVTVIIAAGVFFAGRWAYRQVVGDPEPDTTSVGTNQDETEEEDADDEPPAEESENDAAQDETDGTVAGNTTPEGDLPGTGPGNTLATFVLVSLVAYLAHRTLSARSDSA